MKSDDSVQSDLDLVFMQRALELATQAQSNSEVPVGAVLVRDGQVLGEGANAPISECDVSAHAELIALRHACKAEQNYRLPDTTLYITLEPCAMCAGAIVHARVARVVIAAKEPRAGAAGSIFNVLENDALNHRCEVEYGLLGEQSAEMLQGFFRAKREAAKARKRAARAEGQAKVSE